MSERRVFFDIFNNPSNKIITYTTLSSGTIFINSIFYLIYLALFFFFILFLKRMILSSFLVLFIKSAIFWSLFFNTTINIALLPTFSLSIFTNYNFFENIWIKLTLRFLLFNVILACSIDKWIHDNFISPRTDNFGDKQSIINSKVILVINMRKHFLSFVTVKRSTSLSSMMNLTYWMILP